MRPIVVSLVVFVAAFAAGCGGETTAKSPTAGASEAFPVEIEHAFGTTTIENRPTRIVTLGDDLDSLAAMGITPVGYAPPAPGYSDDVPYLKDRIDLSDATLLKGAHSGQFDIEQIASLRPDLILGTNLVTMDKLYRRLSELAPTVAYEKGWGEASWQEMTTTIGRVVGEPAKAARAVRRSERALAGIRRGLPGLKGKTVASVYYHTAGTFAANPRSESMAKYATLGMRVEPGVLDALPKGSTSNSISLEEIDTLDADFLVLSYSSARLRESLHRSPLYRRLNVVRDNHVYEVSVDDPLETYAGNGSTVLNNPWLLGRQRSVLARVAAFG